jgi:hypothetical protein
VGLVVCKVTLGRIFLPALYFRSADRRTILKGIFKKWGGEASNGLIWLRIGTGECEEFLY